MTDPLPTITSAAETEVKVVEAEATTVFAKAKAFVVRFYPIIIGVLIAATRFL